MTKTILNPTNMGRIAKIQELLGHIQTSILANRASAEEVLELTRPVYSSLEALGAQAPALEEELSPGPSVKHHEMVHWSSAIDMAKRAPLADAVAAMAVIATRVEDELYAYRKRAD